MNCYAQVIKRACGSLGQVNTGVDYRRRLILLWKIALLLRPNRGGTQERPAVFGTHNLRPEAFYQNKLGLNAVKLFT
jgi:hypothetical protein